MKIEEILNNKPSDRAMAIVYEKIAKNDFAGFSIIALLYSTFGKKEIIEKIYFLHIPDWIKIIIGKGKAATEGLLSAEEFDVLLKEKIEVINYIYLHCYTTFTINKENRIVSKQALLSVIVFLRKLLHIEDSDTFSGWGRVPLMMPRLSISRSEDIATIFSWEDLIFYDINEIDLFVNDDHSLNRSMFWFVDQTTAVSVNNEVKAVFSSERESSNNADALKLIIEPFLKVSYKGHIVFFIDYSLWDKEITKYMSTCGRCKYLIELPIECGGPNVAVFSMNEDHLHPIQIDTRSFFSVKDHHPTLDYQSLLFDTTKQDSLFAFNIIKSLWRLFGLSEVGEDLDYKKILDSTKDDFSSKDLSSHEAGLLEFISNFVGVLISCPLGVRRFIYMTFQMVSLFKDNKSRLIALENLHKEISVFKEETTIISGEQKKIVGYRVDFSSLKRSIFNCEINFNHLAVKEAYGMTINQPCLLVGCINGETRVGKITYLPEEPVVVSDNITAFTLNGNYIPDFFLDMMLKMLFSSTTKNGLIPKPSIKVQQDYLTSLQTKKIQEEEARRTQELEAYKTSIHQKKHSVGQEVFNLRQSLEVLKKAIDMNGGVLRSDYFIGRSNPMTTSDYLLQSLSTLELIQRKLRAFTIDDDVQYKEEFVPLSDFILDYMNDHKSTEFEFKYSDVIKLRILDICSHSPVHILEGHQSDEVFFSKRALEVIFDNIIFNAVAHGFEGIHDRKNIIKITTYTHGTTYVIEIANNGKPMDQAMTPERVFEYGESTGRKDGKHSGIGCYEVSELMKRFHGKAEVKLSPEEEFPVTFIFTFYENILTKSN